MQGPGQGAEAIGMLAGMICAFVFFAGLLLLIHAVILRAACSIFNRVCQPENCVPGPSFGKAILIVFVTNVAQNIVSFGIGVVTGIVAAVVGFDEDVATIIAVVFSIPFVILIAGVINTWLLPTTFVRGLLVALLHVAIVIAVGLVIGVVVVVVMLAVGGMGAFR